MFSLLIYGTNTTMIVFPDLILKFKRSLQIQCVYFKSAQRSLLITPKTLENHSFPDDFRGYWKRPKGRNGLIDTYFFRNLSFVISLIILTFSLLIMQWGIK